MLVFLMRFKVSCIIYYFLHLGCSLFGLFVPHFAFLACNLSAYKISFIKNSLRNFRDYISDFSPSKKKKKITHIAFSFIDICCRHSFIENLFLST